jgi:phosphate transport system substrate-binding protein
LQSIFAGRARNWRDFESGETDIVPVARAPGSGTASLFDERIMGEKPYAASVQRLPTNEAIVAEVAARPGAIGYTSFGALRGAGDRVKVVALRTQPQSIAVTPSAETIRSAQYPLTRTLYLGTVGKATGTPKAFTDFCLGISAQPLLQRAGYVSISHAP